MDSGNNFIKKPQIYTDMIRGFKITDLRFGNQFGEKGGKNES